MKKILIVDDVDFNRTYLSKKLCYQDGKLILEPVTAENIHQSIDIIQTIKPNIVVTDINLPDGNGFQLAQLAKKIIPTLPIIYITAYSLTPFLETIKQYGIEPDAIFTKPYNLEAMRTAISFFTDIDME